MVKKILIVLVLIPFLILAFAPKKELFYMLQKQLASQNIAISGGKIHENPIGLSIEHPSLFVRGAKVADVGSISVWTGLVYSHGTIDVVTFDPSLKTFVPSKLENLLFTHSIIKPTQLSLMINDKEYQGIGTVDLRHRSLKFHFTKIPRGSPLMVYLKSNKGGWDYERNF